MANTSVAVQVTGDQAKRLCERKHPDYGAKLAHWQFLLSTYESSRDWFANNIFKFLREGPDTFAGRLQRAYRFNHTREIVDLVNKYLFKVKPQRNPDVSPAVKRFRKRATLSGLSLEAFEEQVSKMSSIFGRVHVVVDSNKRNGEIATVADENSGNVRLYAYIVLPEDFIDCGFDENGNYEWVLLRELVRDDDDPFTASGAISERYRLWTKTDWFLFNKDRKKRDVWVYSMAGHDSHDLGVVPVLKADHIESDKKYSVPALIEDIAYLDRAIANYLSNLDQIINDQTFSQLTMPAQGVLPGISTLEGLTDSTDPDAVKARNMVLKMGTSQILLYDGEHGEAPSYISPDPRQANLILSTIKQIINEIYHTVGLAGERTKQDNSAGIDNSSGVAKAFDFERVNALLSAKASAMQNFSNRLERLVSLWNGEDVEVDSDDETAQSVLYSTEFDVRGLADELTVAIELGAMSAPIEVRRLHMKSLVKKLWPMLGANVRKNLEQAIDEWDDQMYLPIAPSGTGPSDPKLNTPDRDARAPGNPKS